MSFFDKKPLTRITLCPGEVHLHSAVIVRATSNKLFGFVGPKVYGIQPLSPRYRAHITDQRFLMEIYPYSGTEKTVLKWGLKGVSMLMGSFVDTPQLHAQIAVQKMMYDATMDENLAAANDPNAQYIAIPYDTLTVTTFGSAPSYLKLEIPGVDEEIVFMVQLDTEGRLIAKGNIIDNAKAGWKLSREFATLCQEAINSFRLKKDSLLAGMVNLPGSYQVQVGCPGDWQPGCTTTQLTEDENGLWRSGPYNLKAGKYEFKVALNGSWETNYGSDGKQNGPNYKVTLSANSAIEFAYDPATKLITWTIHELG